MTLQVITPTGDRPRAWELCRRWMAQQDYMDGMVWYVVDDGRAPIEYTPEATVARLPHRDSNTQARNLRHLLSMCDPTLPIVVWEDDDYYAPGYLSAAAEWLKRGDLVGEVDSRYYNVATRRYIHCNNFSHCSLMSTAMQGDATELFGRVLRDRIKFIDLELWRRFTGVKYLAKTRHTVGIKGLPGRRGIGAGHRLITGKTDLNGDVLRRWIGPAANLY